MPLDFARIESVIDIVRMQETHVAVGGVGGSATLITDIARCGTPEFTLFDFDTVELSNVARQDHDSSRIGMPKVNAVKHRLREINPDVIVHPVIADFTALTDTEIDWHFRDVNLLIMATDNFEAQAKGNQVALRRGIPAIFVGIYPGGQGGEVIFWHPGLHCCMRCLCPNRYAIHATPTPPIVTSDGASILDLRLVDGIAGMIAVGMLTRGADNRYGRLIDQLGDRNFLQIKLDPLFEWNGHDLFRDLLQIPAENDAYFSFVTVARRDPDRGSLPCPDCERFRGHRFVETNGIFRRIPENPSPFNGKGVEPWKH